LQFSLIKGDRRAAMNINIEGIILCKMINYFGSDARRINHALKVYSFSRAIAGNENINDTQLDILTAAAILHDIGIKVSEEKYNSSSGHYQEIEGPGVARELLADTALDHDFIERVCYLIGHHHTYNAIDGADFQILVEADFLVNAFEDNLGGPEIESISKKIFKTETGKKFIKDMYLSK
jgi:HD-GYP domain